MKEAVTGLKDRSPLKRMNLPNRLTLLRICLVPVFILFAALANLHGHWSLYLLAALVFSGASLTDYFDGMIARRDNLVTDFGKFADPLADKMLTTCALLYMMQAGTCPALVLCLVMAREFAVAGIRMVAAGAHDARVIAANRWGKLKTLAQMLTVLFFYYGSAIFSPDGWVGVVTRAACWLVAVLTLLSGGIYLWENRQFLQDV